MHTIRNLLCLSVISLIISGCSTPSLIPDPTIFIEHSNATISTPVIGSRAIATTGDSLYVEKTVNRAQKYEIVLDDPAVAEMDLGNLMSLPIGATGPMLKSYRDGFTATCWDFVTKSPTGPIDACLLDRSGKGTFDVSMFKNRDKVYYLKAPVRYRIIPLAPEVTINDTTSFKRDVLYQGLSKGSIKLSFKEYIGDMARPAFTQEVLYDLEVDGTKDIRFKGLSLKVLKATSNELTYIVESPFSH